MTLKYFIPDGDNPFKGNAQLDLSKKSLLGVLTGYHTEKADGMEEEMERKKGMAAHKLMLQIEHERMRVERCMRAEPDQLDIILEPARDLSREPPGRISIEVSGLMSVNDTLCDVTEPYDADASHRLLKRLAPPEEDTLRTFAFWKHADYLRSKRNDLNNNFPDGLDLKSALSCISSHLFKLERVYRKQMKEIRNRAKRERKNDSF